jgi:hypothetical protein
VWVLWLLGALVLWLVVGLLLGVTLGRGIRLADRSEGRDALVPVPGGPSLVPGRAVRPPVISRIRRRAIPLPPLGVGLAAVAVAVETAGYLSRLTGATGAVDRLLALDEPFSLPRVFVAGLFGAAAIAAVAGAGVLPGRRAWWLAVGLVGGAIAAVKVGSTVHKHAMEFLTASLGARAAVGLSAGLALLVVGALWFLSRTERRDRRRVLGVLALYGVASVGLSAVSTLAENTYGWASNWAAATTFVEEAGEALAAVAFLMAVLVGVAPRLVLPATWPLRRSDDALTLDVPEQLPGRTAARGNAQG